jgi:ribosomal protein S18 acetylase RimI-like enzyme
MATAPLLTPHIIIAPLESVELATLEPLLDEQCEEWYELLEWNYAGPSRMMREVIRDHDLSGFVAMVGGEAIGFTYYVIDSHRASIGEIYVSKPWRGAGVDRKLAEAVLQKLEWFTRLRRIESQNVNIDHREASQVFLEHGFTTLERCYMKVYASQFSDADLTINEAQPFYIRGWQEEDFSQVVKVIYTSYQNSIDSRINYQYTSDEGCADLLTIMTQHIWCGEFLPHISRIAIDPATNRIAGIVIASRISPGVGHITQISVKPTHQNRGLGRLLLRSALHEFFQFGFRSVSLAVTRDNHRAMRLYESCGFQTLFSFPVFFLNK